MAKSRLPQKKKGANKGKEKKVKFTVDCSVPVEDSILDPAGLEKFYQDRIKVDNKTGNLGDKVSIVRDRSRITVQAELPFAKRYLKYLTKKYLKRHQLRDYLRVLANGPQTYELRYYEMNTAAEEEE
eukprot:GHVQ01000248.1.p2 GENE.GHVQ01000248.1~~GHVQ01000248.1.p2  ORF type:complete len:127 (+),score=22.34 GHVQ01000248.1:185-565(+)